jgi:hypothetical protein
VPGHPVTAKPQRLAITSAIPRLASSLTSLEL